MSEQRALTWSYGGGTQSVAIAVLVAQGRLPKPDVIAMADTGREATETWEYHRAHVAPLLASVGSEVEVAPHTLATVDLYPTKDTGRSLLPLFTEGGSLPTYCSVEWKRRVVRRLLRSKGYGPARPVDLWLGISLDEVERLKPSDVAWLRHRWPLCFDVRLTRAECRRLVLDAGLPEPPKSSCWMCLAGETEVVTRDGIRPIAELAGQSPELLVPIMGKLGGLSDVGKFRAAPVRALGVQRLWAVVVRRGRATKTVHATAEHRWVLAQTAQWAPMSTAWRTTKTLAPGDRLRNLRASPLVKEYPLPLAVMQGFVFGDGARGEGDRPASLFIHPGKDEALLPLFAVCRPRPGTNNGGPGHFVYGLPRTWKAVPDLRESRSFLLGWLSGYFAADGSVTKQGQATLYSARRDHLEYVRSVCAVLGIRASGVLSRMRTAKGDRPLPLHALTLRMRDVPPEFFLLAHHRARIDALRPLALDDHWTVHEVFPTSRVEEVFCATVDDEEAFGLADGLMTGNCPFRQNAQWRRLKEAYPQDWARAVALDAEVRGRDREGAVYLHHSRVALAEADLGRVEEVADLPLFAAGCQTGMCWT